MPAIAIENGKSTGHGCFPPTPDVGPYTNKSFFNGSRIQLRGVTQYATHSCGLSVHPQNSRVIKNVPGTFYLEGQLVAFVGDELTDAGDFVGKGSPSAFAS
jgi:uncharacterized Zn-binding protein involved in type VI secretion